MMLMEQVEDFLEIPNFDLYNNLSTRIHTTRKASIPQAVVDRAAERVAPEDTFLKQHFGEDFYARTK